MFLVRIKKRMKFAKRNMVHHRQGAKLVNLK